MLGTTNRGSGQMVAAGLRWAIEQGYMVVNLSLSTTKKQLAGLFHRDVAFVDQLLHQPVEEPLHLLLGHSLQLLHHLLKLFIAEKLSVLERLLDGTLQLIERMLVEFAEAHALRVEAALQKVIGQRAQQILGVDAEIVSVVARVFDPLHGVS